MKKITFIQAVRHTLCAAVLIAMSGQASAGSTYRVHLDTSSFAGIGWLDLQFNPGMDTAPAATATVSGFTGVLDNTGLTQVAGDISGILPGTVTLGNSAFFNDLFQSVVLGGMFDFIVDFDGAFSSAVSNVGTTFAVSLYADDQMTPLGNADAAGSLLRFELFPAATGGISFGISDPSMVSVNEVPEPSELLLFLLGIMMLARTFRRNAG